MKSRESNHFDHWAALEQAMHREAVLEINIHRRRRKIRPYEISFRLGGQQEFIQVLTQRDRQPRRWANPQTLVRLIREIAPCSPLPRIFIAFDPC